MKKTIILFQLILICSFVWGQKTITGKVTDEKNNPLADVIVIGKQSKVSTKTDAKGTYKITVPQNEKTLIFSHSNFGEQEMAINGKTVNCRFLVKAITDSVLIAEPEVMLEEVKMYSIKEERKKVSAPSSNVSGNIYYNPSTEEYNKIHENGFKNVKMDPLSTFSIDVDRASYSNIRRYLNLGQKVPADAVRIEEMINYFDYDYPQPKGDNPYSITAEYSDCPWQANHKLLHIGLQGKKIPMDNLPVSNIVFLLDVSGSMNEANKLPLLKSSIKLLVNNLREKDKISIVVYAGAAGVVLNPTNGNDKAKIMEAIDNLQAGGSTAGGEGIMLAYKTAEENFIKGGNNRIVLCTDGDFNVGVSNPNELEDLITKKRESGVYLTCLGFGMGNYKDNKIETLANKGNGNYAYIDNIQEANKTLVSEFGGTMFTIAKDVKLQIEFNPSVVQAYRLVGYENRMLNNEDFKDDKKDAGEMGAGHTVTAIYEIIPVGIKSEFVKEVDDLKYQNNKNNNSDTKEVVTIKTRYKKPDGDTGIDYNIPVPNKTIELNKTSDNYRFSSSVAMFGMLLRGSEFKGTSSYDQVIEQADKSKGNDSEGYKAEFVRLVKTAKTQ
jgi:Ca-activated chloride channel family protein